MPHGAAALRERIAAGRLRLNHGSELPAHQGMMSRTPGPMSSMRTPSPRTKEEPQLLLPRHGSKTAITAQS